MNTWLNRKSNYFTLTELAVVLSIIALLAATLLPVLTPNRGRGETSCSDNLKQIGFANIQYAQDNDNFITPANNGRAIWRAILSPYLKNADPDVPRLPSVFHCPDDHQIVMFDKITHVNLSYAMNGFVGGDYSGGSGPDDEFRFNYSSIQSPNEIVFAGDSNKAVPYSWGGGGFTPDDWVRAGVINGSAAGGAGDDPTCRHQGYAYSDSCVTWIKAWIAEDHTDGLDPGNNAKCLKLDGSPHADAWACRAPAFRHDRSGNKTGSANFVNLDGHLTSYRIGQMKTWNLMPNESPAQRKL